MGIIGLLERLGIEPSAEDLADIYWLAIQMSLGSAPEPTVEAAESAFRPFPKPTHPAAGHAPTTSVADASLDERPSEAPPRSDLSAPAAAPAQTVPIHGYRQAPLGTHREDLPITLSSAPALSNQLDLARALRPLMRRVASRIDYTLDEQTSAEQIADSRILMPVLRPQPARWLDVMLILDRAPSMAIWRQAVDEWKVLIERLGAFRDVRLWSLETNEHTTVRLSAGWGLQRREARDPGELTDPSGRRLIILLSDCVAPAWRGGAVQKLLMRWGSRNHVALLQMLPSDLWQRSLLGLYDAGSVAATIAAGASAQLSFDEVGLPGVGMPLPVLNLTRESLKDWAALVIGSRAATPGFWITAEVAESSEATAQIEISGEERVQRFKFFASVPAWRLAQALAAAPLSPPVMRLVHQAVVDKPSTGHLAEVMLGGLFHRIPGRGEDFTFDEVQYEFYPGVRERLLDGRSVAEQIGILEHVARFIGARLGLSFSFRGMLVDPKTFSFEALREANPEFATLAVDVLRRMGGRYTELADRMDRKGVTALKELASQARITENPTAEDLHSSGIRLVKTPEHSTLSVDTKSIRKQDSPLLVDNTALYKTLVSYQETCLALQQTGLSENTIILRAQAKDQLEQIFFVIEPNLRRLAIRIAQLSGTRSNDTVETIKNSLFAGLIEDLPRIHFDIDKNIVGLLITIADRKWRDESKRLNPRIELPLSENEKDYEYEYDYLWTQSTDDDDEEETEYIFASSDIVEGPVVDNIQSATYYKLFQEFIQTNSTYIDADLFITKGRLSDPPISYRDIASSLGQGWSEKLIQMRWYRLTRRFRNYLLESGQLDAL